MARFGDKLAIVIFFLASYISFNVLGTLLFNILGVLFFTAMAFGFIALWKDLEFIF